MKENETCPYVPLLASSIIGLFKIFLYYLSKGPSFIKAVDKDDTLVIAGITDTGDHMTTMP